MGGTMDSASRLSMASDAARKSRRRSRRRDLGAMKEQPGMDWGKVAVSAAVSTLTIVLMFIAFTFINLSHFLVMELNRARVLRLSKRDEHMVMGRVMRGSIARVVVDWNPFWNVSHTAEVPLRKLPQRCIFMCNHLSFADPFMLCSAQRPLESKYVAMSTLFSIPIAGRTAVASGDMEVHFVRDPKHGRWRTKTGTLSDLMERARGYLDEDVSLSVFPEGRISRTGELLQFKKGFFRLAVETNSPIVPVAMWGSQDAWPTNKDPSQPSNGGLLGPANVQIRFGAPVQVAGRPLRDIMLQVYTAIQEMRNALPNCDLAPELAHLDPVAVLDKAPRSSLVRDSEEAREMMQAQLQSAYDEGEEGEGEDHAALLPGDDTEDDGIIVERPNKGA